MNEIETMLCKLLGCDRGHLYLDRDSSPLTSAQAQKLEKMLKKRLKGEPLQYLLGDVEFMGLSFKVGPGVFIPRPETEILVEEVILNTVCARTEDCRVLDLCTGSGNIAIALAAFLKGAKVLGVDISKDSLVFARSNAAMNGVAENVHFWESDLFSCLEGKEEVFDCIVSNPPYIPVEEYAHLPSDVRKEPVRALLADGDGCVFYSRIEEGARQYLENGGFLFLEIGDGQAQRCVEIFGDVSIWRDLKFRRDYHGAERVAVVQKQGVPKRWIS